MLDALYIHVPFCHAKCLYCDFDSRACRDRAAYEAYAASMIAYLGRLGSTGALAPCRTAYIGGGTPSVLGERLVALASAVHMMAPGLEEFTCEANPESFTWRLAHALAGAGVTRISLGVQSFDDAELRALGRLHTADKARVAIAAALDAGLAASCDLMCGIPLQTEESWVATLDAAIATGIGHVSVYPLTIEEGTPLARKVDAGEVAEPDPDFQAWCMEEARRRLMAAGMHPYEVASYARPGKECAHNIAYWTGRSYLGLGRSAASMLDRETYDALRTGLGAPEVAGATARIRFVQTTDALPGEAEVPRYELEEMSAREAAAEDLMLGMRMSRGVGDGLLAYAREVIGTDAVDTAIDEALARGLAVWEELDGARHLAPTHDGWLLGNELYGLFWDLAA
ncbi:radical SAM family heme chaperone HemW [Collinsella tanakaei]|uniref:radical SAM family heme chaperone HemW n=1 Tax=Collinsella tanakaei TaxID=626935 RepID=UPI0025A47E2C|nr:radical SAM family heme chaperone HemW [Collinsella tanakaei]MDM8245189.1 radical SAM family heme chaperone HemW [Collinsella tanakaei]